MHSQTTHAFTNYTINLTNEFLVNIFIFYHETFAMKETLIHALLTCEKHSIQNKTSTC